MVKFPTFEGLWPWPWIGSYCIPPCITHRPLPTLRISFISKKHFVYRRTCMSSPCSATVSTRRDRMSQRSLHVRDTRRARNTYTHRHTDRQTDTSASASMLSSQITANQTHSIVCWSKQTQKLIHDISVMLLQQLNTRQLCITESTRWKVLWESTNPRESEIWGFCWQHLPHLLIEV